MYGWISMEGEKFIFFTLTGKNKKDLLSKLAAMPKTLNNSSNLISCMYASKI